MLDKSIIIYFVNGYYDVIIVWKVFCLKAIVYLKQILNRSAVTYLLAIS